MNQIPNIEEEIAKIDGANVSGGDIHYGLHNAINHVFFALEADEYKKARNEVFAEVREIVTTLIHQQLQKAREEERHSLLTTIKAMSWDANNETPDAIRILKELYDLLSKPDHSELDQDKQ